MNYINDIKLNATSNEFMDLQQKISNSWSFISTMLYHSLPEDIKNDSMVYRPILDRDTALIALELLKPYADEKEYNNKLDELSKTDIKFESNRKNASTYDETKNKLKNLFKSNDEQQK